MSRSSGRAFLLRCGCVALVVAIIWWVAAYEALPRIIRSAYDGTSVEFANGWIQGQAYHPVERYLAAGARLARLGSLLLPFGLIITFAAIWWRNVLGRLWSGLAHSDPRGGFARIVLTAVSIGVIFAFVEVSLAWIRFRAGGYISTFTNVDVFWMGPLAQGTLFAGFAAVLFVCSAGWRQGLSYRVLVVVCCTIGAYGAARGLRSGLHPLAIWALALGVGFQLARLVDARAGLRRWVPRIAIPAVVVLAAGPLLYPSANRYRVDARSGASGAGRPNIVLLVLDTVRGESLGLYGYDRDVTPNLDRLGREGVVFERAIAPSPWTLPTHASMFTGRHTIETRVAWDVALDTRYATIAEWLGTFGYARGGFVANHGNAGRATGLARGFNTYVDHSRSPYVGVTGAFVPRRLTEWAWGALPTPWATVDRKYAPRVNKEFLGWLDSSVEDEPFFAFLNYFDVHGPYELHEDYASEFTAEDRMPLFTRAGRPRSMPPNRALQIDSYDSSIAFLDHHVGLLRDELESRGVLDNTILIITSDHGEHLGERGLMDHGNSLYSQLLRVPLLVHWPGQVPGGVRVPHAVSLTEMPATIADLAGATGPVFPGSSLRRFWLSDDPITEAVLSEVYAAPGAGFAAGRVSLGTMRSMVQGDFHYIRNGDGSVELYDLATDPREMHDLAGTERGAIELPRLRVAFDRLLDD